MTDFKKISVENFLKMSLNHKLIILYKIFLQPELKAINFKPLKTHNKKQVLIRFVNKLEVLAG